MVYALCLPFQQCSLSAAVILPFPCSAQERCGKDSLVCTFLCHVLLPQHPGQTNMVEHHEAQPSQLVQACSPHWRCRLAFPAAGYQFARSDGAVLSEAC